MPPVLNVDRELGRKIKQAREQRGWSKPLLAAMIGPVGNPPRGLVPNQITRIESGERNLSADEAWRLVDLYDEIDPWEILAAARAVSEDSSEEFRQAIREEANRRRRRGTLRRLDFAAPANGVTARKVAIPIASELRDDALLRRLGVPPSLAVVVPLAPRRDRRQQDEDRRRLRALPDVAAKKVPA